MATAYKTAQIQGTSSVDTYATLYNVPSATSAVISTITICNTSGSVATYRIGLDESAGTPSASEWLVYGSAVGANDTIFLTVGLSLDAGKHIRISSSSNALTFSASVSEIS
jgi:hypothetical protein